MIPGIYLGYVHKAVGLVGPDSYVVPLRQLDGLNMESGRTPEGKRPTIEKSVLLTTNRVSILCEKHTKMQRRRH
eukprot:4483681-Pyramimonas_sp.AAC.1